MAETKPIGGALAFGLIVFGILIDLLQAILALLLIGELLDPAIDVVAMIGFAIMLHGRGGTLSKRSISYALTSIGEFIPVVDALPLWTLWAIYVVVMDRAKHAMHHEEPSVRLPGSRRWRL